MKQYMKFFMLASVLIMLGACSSDEETIEVEKPAVNETKFDLMGNETYSADYSDEYSGDITEYSNSSIEVFSLDGASPNFRRQSNTPMSSEGRPYIGSSNVEIAPVGQPQNSVIRTAPANMNARQPMTRPVASEASAYKGAALSSEPSAEDAAVRIFFDHGSSSLDEYGMQQLSQVLRNNQGMMLSVEGYASGRTASTNPVQSKQINLDMSMERAVAVANALIASGVPADHIRTVAWGEETNIANVQGMSVEEASRRVDVIPFRK